MITVNNLTVQYPTATRPAVRKVTLQVEQGQIATLIGPNGSGKSSILKAILGLVDFSGEVVLGDSLHGDSFSIGYVPQRYHVPQLLPLQVQEFLGLALVTCSHPQSEQQKMIASALKDVGATRLLQKRIDSLSGGQLQRVLLARALVHQPQLLLLDEPEAGVDVTGEADVYQLLMRLVKERELTVLIASHELELIQHFADVVFCINQELVCHGSPHQVLTAQNFKKLYGQHAHHYHHHEGRV